MPETPKESGDLSRQPPAPDQFEKIRSLVSALTPSAEEVAQGIAEGRDSPSARTYELLDANGEREIVLIKDYTKVPEDQRDEDHRHALSYVAHDPAGKAETFYTIWQDPEAKDPTLDVERFDLDTMSSLGLTALLSDVEKLAHLVGDADLTDEMMQQSDMKHALGLPIGNAAQAEELAALLARVNDQGHIQS